MNAHTTQTIGETTGGQLPPKIIVDFSNTLDPVDRFLDNVLGPGSGYLSLGFGHGPKVKEKDHKRPWHAETYRWPEQRDELRREIDRHQRKHWDAYFCAALQREASRKRRVEADIWALSFELDEEPADPELLDKLDAVIVESGTPGHLHIDVLLAEGVDTATADQLTETIAKAVAGWTPGCGVALKWEANALLRVPDTWNFKNYWADELPARRRSDGHPRRVRIQKAEGKRWQLDELEALCASLTSRKADTGRRRVTPTLDVQLSSEDDLQAYPGVRRALRTWAGTEKGVRNDAHHAVARECYKARIDEESAVALLLRQDWCKNDEHWVRDDVAREYDKAAEEGLPQIPGDEFWDARPILRHIRDFSTERMMPAWAVLGHTLLRVAGNIPPYYVLPDIVGDYGSLNLYIVLCGPPAGGKTASVAVSRRAVPLPFDPPDSPASTGQGIRRCFADAGKDGLVPITQSAILSVDEVSRFRADLNRPGSILLSELNSAWPASTIGAANATREARVILKSHTYRLGLYVGVQPAYADVLLEHVESGFPQRFVWFEAMLPPDAPIPSERVMRPWQWSSPHQPDMQREFILDKEPERFDVIRLPAFVEQLVKEHRREQGAGLVAEIEQHRMFSRLKIAAVLMWMDGRIREVNAEDWNLAGQILMHSDHTRSQAQEYGRKQLARKADAAAVHAGKRADRLDEVREAQQVERAKNKILVMLEGGPRVKGHVLTRGMTASLRPVAEQALDELRRAKKVRVTKTVHPKNGTEIVQCRLSQDHADA